VIWGKREGEYFLKWDWTSEIRLNLKENFPSGVIPGRAKREPGISRFRVWSFGPSRNDALVCFNRSQKFLSLLDRRKTANLAIIRVVLGRSWRANCNKLFAVLLDKFR
jgi:hypothetical protein